ncbi:MAG: AAA family ATPase [Actinomycetota bacterium]|nr:AAA family ATPase [Actinomycetota bacterium]
MTDASAPVRVLLMGMMGTGKSSVGRELSRRTGWRYVDNDELVEIAAGIPTRDVLRQRGEPGLREAESGALRIGLRLERPVIASVAGGVVTVPEDVAALRESDAVVVWLTAPLEVLAERVRGTGRPWELDEDPLAKLTRLYAGREERYRELADIVVDTTRCSPEEAAAQIVEALPVG